MSAQSLSATRALREHWPEYLMEAWGLGAFMVSAGLFATALEYPDSPVHQAIADPALRRAIYRWHPDTGVSVVVLLIFRLGNQQH